jgi:hypothetical protein
LEIIPAIIQKEQGSPYLKAASNPPVNSVFYDKDRGIGGFFHDVPLKIIKRISPQPRCF